MKYDQAIYNAPTGEDVPVDIISDSMHGALPVLRVRVREYTPSKYGYGFVVGDEFDCTTMRITARRKAS